MPEHPSDKQEAGYGGFGETGPSSSIGEPPGWTKDPTSELVERDLTDEDGLPREVSIDHIGEAIMPARDSEALWPKEDPKEPTPAVPLEQHALPEPSREAKLPEGWQPPKTLEEAEHHTEGIAAMKQALSEMIGSCLGENPRNEKALQHLSNKRADLLLLEKRTREL